MSEYYYVLLLLLTIGFIILSGSYLKWHPFLSLVVAAIGFGLLAGIPLLQLVSAMGSGFGTLLGAIGLIVVLGSILGTVLEESGSVQRLGNALQKQARGNPSLGISFLGMILGIPVFCDSGFIILVSLAKSISAAAKIPLPAMTLSLSGGLYTTHTLVPPTPGPVAAAGNLGVSSSLGLIILLGIVISIPVVFVAHYYARRIGKYLHFEITTHQTEARPIQGSLYKSLLLLALPVVLIATASLLELLYKGDSFIFTILRFAGNPMIALLLTVSLALIFFQSQKQSRVWIEKGIRQAGPILVLTGCGGALGAVLKASPIADMISAWAKDQTLSGMGFLFIGFLISSLFKTAQGSSTSAIVIVSALMAPLTIEAGFSDPIELSLLVLAIGAGSMAVSHANDSYFWVVSQFSGFDLSTAYRGITIMSLIQGVTALLMVLLLYLIVV
ncbi:MAG: GntP family permease [Cyclobacteriaceae bacterium]|nr:GntP family permease [Cyclobacteriaceae bacterium]UYN85469.1 MAG: GntP family permease [Cyclobacteriaceae bacterium]